MKGAARLSIQYSLIIFTLFQRLSLGTYLISITGIYLLNLSLELSAISAFSLITLVFGLLVSMFHLGHPERFLFSFSNYRSHLTHEAFLAPIVIVLLFINSLNKTLISLAPFWSVLLQTLTTIAALMFLYSTAKIYHLKSRPAWDTPLVTLIFLASSVLIGILSVNAWLVVIGQNVELLLNIGIIGLLMLILLQIFFLKRLDKLKHILLEQMGSSSYRRIFISWVIFGTVIPVMLITFSLFIKITLISALLVLVSFSVSIVYWMSLSFIVGVTMPFFKP